MQIRVLTLRYNEALQGFPEDALRTATFGREVLNVSEHFFVNGNVRNNNADNCTSSNRNNNNPSNENNNGFRLVSTMSEQTGFHFATPALRRCGDEHAQLRMASSAGDRHAGTFLIGGTGI